MKIIDLSQEIYDDMPVYAGDPQVKIEVVHNYDVQNWQIRKITLGSHTSTHVDAFSHMHKDKDTLDSIPLERFFGKAQVFNVKDDFIKNIGLLFIEAVTIKDLSKILAAQPNFVGGNIDIEVEKALLQNNIITYTNLINLEQIPKNSTFMFYGFPLKIRSGDGSPVRAVAILD